MSTVDCCLSLHYACPWTFINSEKTNCGFLEATDEHSMIAHQLNNQGEMVTWLKEWMV